MRVIRLMVPQVMTDKLCPPYYAVQTLLVALSVLLSINTHAERAAFCSCSNGVFLKFALLIVWVSGAKVAHSSLPPQRPRPLFPGPLLAARQWRRLRPTKLVLFSNTLITVKYTPHFDLNLIPNFSNNFSGFFNVKLASWRILCTV